MFINPKMTNGKLCEQTYLSGIDVPFLFLYANLGRGYIIRLLSVHFQI